MVLTAKEYRKAGIIFIIVGAALFLIPIDYKGVTQQWYVPIALEKGLIFWVIGGILLVFGTRGKRYGRMMSEGPKG